MNFVICPWWHMFSCTWRIPFWKIWSQMGFVWFNKWWCYMYFSKSCCGKKWWICWFYGFENHSGIASGTRKHMSLWTNDKWQISSWTNVLMSKWPMGKWPDGQLFSWTNMSAWVNDLMDKFLIGQMSSLANFLMVSVQLTNDLMVNCQMKNSVMDKWHDGQISWWTNVLLTKCPIRTN